jgi:hypothetical protein
MKLASTLDGIRGLALLSLVSACTSEDLRLGNAKVTTTDGGGTGGKDGGGGGSAGSGGSTGGAGGSSGSGGSGAVDSGHVPPPPDSGAPDVSHPDSGPVHACNSLPVPQKGVQIDLAGAAPPPATGGTVRDGEYELVGVTLYTTTPPSAPFIEGRAHTIEVSGGTWNHVSYFDSAPTVHYTDEATLSGSTVKLRRTCGTDVDAGVFFGAAGKYTATAGGLVLQFPYVTPDMVGTAVLSYHLRGADAGIDCSTVGCGAAPVCGQACAAPCGCCPCGVNDYWIADGKGLQCAGSCYSPADYAVVDLATNVPRIAITKKDTLRSSCFRIELAQLGGAKWSSLDVPTGWVVERAWTSSALADCDAQTPGTPAAAIAASGATGSVTLARDGGGACRLDVDTLLAFTSHAGTPTEALIAKGLAATGCP